MATADSTQHITLDEQVHFLSLVNFVTKFQRNTYIGLFVNNTLKNLVLGRLLVLSLSLSPFEGA